MIKKTAVLLLLAILFNGLLFGCVWVRHLFVTALNPFVGILAMGLALLMVIPLAVLAIKRLARYYKGRPGVDPAVLFALGFLLFLTGDLMNEWVFGPSTIDFQFRDTYYVIAHSHMRMFLALMFLAFSAVYSFYPRITGRAMHAPMGYMHVGLTVVGAYLLVWPVSYTGMAGMPRRYIDDGGDWIKTVEFMGVNMLKREGAILLVCGLLLLVVNFFYSAVRGRKGKAV